MDSGVEISGLQNAYEGKPSDEEKNYYLWSMTNVSDSIIMQKGDKNTRVVINAKDFTRSEEDGKITLTGDVGILPTDIMSTTMYILVNIEVNGVPTQYVAALNSMKFYHGFSYNVKLQVTANEGIFVNTWYNESWTKDLTPD
jgi:lipopolysaccharide export system protein LptA